MRFRGSAPAATKSAKGGLGGSVCSFVNVVRACARASLCAARDKSTSCTRAVSRATRNGKGADREHGGRTDRTDGGRTATDAKATCLLAQGVGLCFRRLQLLRVRPAAAHVLLKLRLHLRFQLLNLPPQILVLALVLVRPPRRLAVPCCSTGVPCHCHMVHAMQACACVVL